MNTFIAIDFETANEQRKSACSIGMVKFTTNGEVLNTYYTLIKPHPEVRYFNPINSWVHGITEKDIEDAPEWSDIAKEVAQFIGEHPIVAHNMAFDGYVLSDLNRLYQQKPIENRRFCTLRLARKILASEIERKSLDNVYYYYFPNEEFTHHQAISDAIACAKIFVRMQEDYPYEQIQELCPPTQNNRSGSLQRPGLYAEQLSAQELIERYGQTPCLEGERIAITGTLKHGQRSAVQELITVLGATAEKSLTKKTTLLIVGIPSPQHEKANSNASRKLLKATALKEAGSPIQVLSEEEFFNRITP
ncbi:exonuclease domain-containing protein [Rothia sp. P6271]|uniref:exonuclease domain-containing protein n=1 Tax=Rothia sp. P6271 TaxID=3402659 RepID=UPI003ACA718A